MRRRPVRLLVLVLIMLHILRAWFSGWSKADIWLFIADGLIVLLILREDIWKLCGWLRRRHRIKAIFQRMNQGQRLQQTAPSGGDDEAKVEDWNKSVDTWNRETFTLLGNYSPQAAASFIHQGYRPTLSYHGVAQQAQNRYHALGDRLDNLRSIMEKPDVYF
jgi:hypothetical protein